MRSTAALAVVLFLAAGFVAADEDSSSSSPGLPHPTGRLKDPPPNTAIIRVQLPDAWGLVLFDGKKCESVGKDRYYVTPSLDPATKYHYTIKTSFKKDGKRVIEERKIDVVADNFYHVDFTRPPPRTLKTEKKSSGKSSK